MTVGNYVRLLESMESQGGLDVGFTRNMGLIPRMIRGAKRTRNKMRKILSIAAQYKIPVRVYFTGSPAEVPKLNFELFIHKHIRRTVSISVYHEDCNRKPEQENGEWTIPLYNISGKEHDSSTVRTGMYKDTSVASLAEQFDKTITMAVSRLEILQRILEKTMRSDISSYKRI